MIKGYFAAFTESPEMIAIGRRALALGWSVVVEQQKDGTLSLSLEHYTKHYRHTYPDFALRDGGDVKRWTKRCAAEVEELDRTKWGQYEGWEKDLPKHCQEIRRTLGK
jgi:hypothetical protein